MRTQTEPVAAEAPVLSIKNIEVIYDHVILVLKGVSLEVPPGFGVDCRSGLSSSSRSSLSATIFGIAASAKKI